MVCSEAPAFAEECGPLRPVIESFLRRDPLQRLAAEEAERWLRSLVREAPEPELALPTAPSEPTSLAADPAIPRAARRVSTPGGSGPYAGGTAPGCRAVAVYAGVTTPWTTGSPDASSNTAGRTASATPTSAARRVLQQPVPRPLIARTDSSSGSGAAGIASRSRSSTAFRTAAAASPCSSCRGATAWAITAPIHWPVKPPSRGSAERDEPCPDSERHAPSAEIRGRGPSPPRRAGWQPALPDPAGVAPGCNFIEQLCSRFSNGSGGDFTLAATMVSTCTGGRAHRGSTDDCGALPPRSLAPEPASLPSARPNSATASRAISRMAIG